MRYLLSLLSTVLLLMGVQPGGWAHEHPHHLAEPSWQHHQQDSIFTRVQVSDRVWLLYGRGGNVGIVVTDDGVLVIDTQFRNIAPGIVRQIRAITDKPIRYVLNTHVHGDHVGGNPVFQQFSDVIAHQNTFERMLEDWRGEGLPKRGDGLPQITFQKELRFYYGGVRLEAFHLGRGHTDTDVVIYLPDEDVVHMGDLLFNDIVPYVDKKRGAHTGGWVRFLRAVYARIRPTTKVIPGHGKLTDREALRKMIGYFQDMRKAVEKAHVAGKSREEILSLKLDKYAGWSGQKRLGMTLGAIYTELYGNGPTLLVVNKSEETVAFVDVPTGDVRAKVKVGPNPHEIAVTPDGMRAYVSNYGSGRPAGRLSWLSVLDVKKLRAVDEIELRDPETGKFLGAPHGVMVTRDGKQLWVTAEGSQAVALIALPEEKVVRVFHTGQRVSHQVVPLPDGSKAYVANIGSGSVSVIDVATGKVKTIPCEAGTEGIDVTPDGRYVWAANRSANSISVIDTEEDRVVETLKAGNFPIRVKFTPDGKRALVSFARDNAVGVYDVATRKLVRTIETGSMPIGLLIDPEGKQAFVANTQADQVSVIDLQKWEVIGRIHTGDEPDGLGYAKGQ